MTVRHTLEALHVLFAIFAVGPLVGAASIASRGIRTADAAAVQTSATTIRRYSYVSLLVALFGFSLVQSKYHRDFADVWIWLSVLLYIVAVLVALFVLVPALAQAGEQIAAGQSPASLAGRVAATGGIVSLVFAVIVVLMVFKPGS
jgi:uncharacterized membrane protein